MKNKRTSTQEGEKDLKDVHHERFAHYGKRSDDSDLEKDRLMQELQVHQFELEMQRIKSLGIYELAPIGYSRKRRLYPRPYRASENFLPLYTMTETSCRMTLHKNYTLSYEVH